MASLLSSDDKLERAREILWRYYRREGRMPSYQEICSLFGYASKNAAYKLIQKFIELDFIQKTNDGHLLPKKLSPPLKVLGSVQAGFPTPAEEELLDTLSLDDYLLGSSASTFILKVSGDSMIDEGIRPEDLVIIDKRRSPKHGDVVLAEIDGNWTLKYFQKNQGQVRLVAANKKYPPLYPKQELVLAGVVTGVVRKY